MDGLVQSAFCRSYVFVSACLHLSYGGGGGELVTYIGAVLHHAGPDCILAGVERDQLLPIFVRTRRRHERVGWDERHREGWFSRKTLPVSWVEPRTWYVRT